MLADALRAAGFTFVPGNGAFYLLLAAPDGDEQLLLDRLAACRIIAVGGTDFGCPAMCAFRTVWPRKPSPARCRRLPR